jgi:hypothetical protein
MSKGAENISDGGDNGGEKQAITNTDQNQSTTTGKKEHSPWLLAVAAVVLSAVATGIVLLAGVANKADTSARLPTHSTPNIPALIQLHALEPQWRIVHGYWQGTCVELDQNGDTAEMYTRWAVVSTTDGTYMESILRTGLTGGRSWVTDVQGDAVLAFPAAKTVVESLESRTLAVGNDNALQTYFRDGNKVLTHTRLISFRETAGVQRRIVSTQSFSGGFEPSGLVQCHDEKLTDQAAANKALLAAGLEATPEPQLVTVPPPITTATYEPELCNASGVELADYPQWRDEHGYWVGEYSYFGNGMVPNYVPDTWNYPYDHYRGFITGSVNGGSYSQRNTFFYPPQKSELCAMENNTFIEGEDCGSTGSVKLFEADQTTQYCDERDGGRISGPYGEDTTTTTLVGDQAVLYQIWSDNSAGDSVFYQSQMTTITKLGDQTRRTRTAQFWEKDTGEAMWFSFYRELKVSEREFWITFNVTRKEYSVSDAAIDKRCSGGLYNLKQFLGGSMDWDGDKYSCPIKVPQTAGANAVYAMWTTAGVSGWANYYPDDPVTEGAYITASQLAKVPGATVESLSGYAWLDLLAGA